MNLTTKAFRTMQAKFKRHEHRPSQEQLQALRDIHETLTAQADGKTKPAYYVCSVDPGVGKSLAISAWVQAFLDDHDYEHVGVLICVDRYDEVEAFANSISESHWAAVVTRGHSLNDIGLGARNADQARVLFTTKEQLRRRSRGRCFTELSRLFYLGKPRQVRIWDEGLLVADPLTLRRLSLGTLLDPLAEDQALVGLVEDVMTKIRDDEDRSSFTIPPLPISQAQWLRLFSEQADDVKEIAYSFSQLAGRKVTIRHTYKGHVLLDKIEAIPDDFKPCLVTDASARVRATYRLHEQYRGDIVWLKKALKDYSRLTCHVVTMPSGITAYQHNDSFSNLVTKVADVINGNPDEQFVVIHHRESGGNRGNLPKAVKRLLGTGSDRVQFLHWGMHTATNRFREIPNVILAGVLQYPNEGYEALARAAAGKTTEQGVFDRAQLSEVRAGEASHHVLQAASRGLIRTSKDGACPHTNLWVIASRNTGITKLLPTIFPECRVKQCPSQQEVTLQGKAAEAHDFLKSCKESEQMDVPLRKVLNHIKIKDWHTFNRDIYSKNELFRQYLADLGYCLVGEGRQRGFVMTEDGQQTTTKAS